MKSLLNFSVQNTICCHSKKDLMKKISTISCRLHKYGYCVVRMWDSTESSLVQFRNCLGRGQLHIRANKNGVVTIAPNTQLNHKKIDESQYLGSSNRHHPPHTDGAYLDGFLCQDGEFIWIGPPTIVLIQCVRPAVKGGTNIVIDAQPILQDLLKHQPEIAKTLLMPGCVSFCRDDQMLPRVSVYERLSAHRFRIRFRSDEALYVSPSAYEAVQYLYDYYIHNPAYQQPIDLEAGQILILDNFRVLHGREGFEVDDGEKERFFRRTWILDENQSPSLINFSGVNRNCRAFARLEPYAIVEQSGQQPRIGPHLGIHLPRHLQEVLDAQVAAPLPIAG